MIALYIVMAVLLAHFLPKISKLSDAVAEGIIQEGYR